MFAPDLKMQKSLLWINYISTTDEPIQSILTSKCRKKLILYHFDMINMKERAQRKEYFYLPPPFWILIFRSFSHFHSRLFNYLPNDIKVIKIARETNNWETKIKSAFSAYRYGIMMDVFSKIGNLIKHFIISVYNLLIHINI